MADTNLRKILRYRGHSGQIPIYLGKQFRGFVYRNDWKVLPMAALIAALVSLVVRGDFFVTMEGTLKGALALSCVSIWNGFFNSIQVICRERAVVKREHRSGMHVFSYVAAHMIYQALLCLLQSGVTMYVCKISGVKFPDEGILTPWMIVDIQISVFLISYAADMMSLFVSSVAHTTTAAMTVIPFLLIFQLVFSGGIFTLPSWASGFSKLTVSGPGLKCITAQAGYNTLPTASGWNILVRMEGETVSGVVNNGQLARVGSSLADAFGAGDSKLIKAVAGSIEAGEPTEEALDMSVTTEEFIRMHNPEKADEIISELRLISPETLETRISLADYLELIDLEELRDEEHEYSFEIGTLLDILGREKVKDAIETKTAGAAVKPEYERTEGNILSYWGTLMLFVVVFAFATMVSLKFIDKDKR